MRMLKHLKISYTASVAVAPATKSINNGEPVVFKHPESSKRNLCTASLALAVWPPSTYLKSVTVGKRRLSRV